MDDRKVVPPPQPPANNPGESLDKVRDILFGAQAREFEQRFALLEEQLLQKTDEARQESQRRLEALEAQVRQEVKQLTDNLKAEQAQRTETIKSLASEVKTLAQNLDQKINQLESRSTKGQGDLQQQLLAQTKALSTQLEQRAEVLQASLQREAKNLDEGKANRVDLANLFTEMAKRLTGEKGK